MYRPPPPFRFELTEAAAEFNGQILRNNHFDLDRIIFGTRDSNLAPGAEFRPATALEPILAGHPLWPRVQFLLNHGSHYPLEPISESERMQDLSEAIEFGNHKSAQKDGHTMLSTLSDEVRRGWQLPLPIELLDSLPTAVVSPMGLADQMALQPDGSRIPSKRLTHDMTYSFSSGKSVNKRVKHEELTTLVYGFALRRYLHVLVSLRRRFPSRLILQSKFDLKAAYRRLQASPSIAVQQITTTKGLRSPDIPLENDLALVALRLTFGGAANPSLFSDISESMADIANALFRCPQWQPSTTPSSFAHVVETPILVLEQDPTAAPCVAEARQLLLGDSIPDGDGAADVFLDDIFGAYAWDGTSPPDRIAQAILTVIDTVGCPVSDADRFPRDPLLSLKKASAEGTPTESLVILGWIVDTHHFRLRLPPDKHKAWSSDLSEAGNLTDRHDYIPTKTLESLIGRLSHVATVIRPASHFLSRLRFALHRASKSARQRTRLTKAERDDIQLWQRFLDTAATGFSINLTTLRMPDGGSLTDACEAQLGGFSLRTGRAWRWTLPPDCVDRVHINLLEFIACTIGILLPLHEGEIQPLDCWFSGTDNTSAEGWLHKTNFTAAGDNRNTHLVVARHLATTLLDNNFCLFSQWIAGSENTIADCLSRTPPSTHSDKQLTHLIHSTHTHSQLLPQDFKVYPLPNAIDSLVGSWVRLAINEKESPKAPTLASTPTGDSGSASSTWSVLAGTPSSTRSLPTTASVSFAPLPKPTARRPSPPPLRVVQNWLRRHAVPPSRTLARPLATPDDPTQRETTTNAFIAFYSSSSEGTKTMTRVKDDKRPSLSNFSSK